MKKFEVWLEGYVISGNRNKATFEGTFDAITFAEACQMWFNALPIDQQDFFDPAGGFYWGRKLFDNESDARKLFG